MIESFDAFTEKHLRDWIDNNFDLSQGEEVYQLMTCFLGEEEGEDQEYFISQGWQKVYDLAVEMQRILSPAPPKI